MSSGIHLLNIVYDMIMFLSSCLMRDICSLLLNILCQHRESCRTNGAFFVAGPCVFSICFVKTTPGRLVHVQSAWTPTRCVYIYIYIYVYFFLDCKCIFHNESRNHKEQFPAQSVPLGHIISIEFGTTNLDRRTPDLSSLDGSYSVPPPNALAQELLTDGPLYVSLLLYEERETCSMIRRPAKHVVTLLRWKRLAREVICD